MIWFTADTHFSHKNILRYCNRPFSNIREHDKALIENWNNRVKKEDVVYHLGDFGFGAKGYLIEIIKQLNGEIYFIRGNHDKSMKGDLLLLLSEDVPYKEIFIQDPEIGPKHKQMIILCHYAFEVWNKKHYGSWHFHGHSHGTLKTPKNMARIDVGVDRHNYAPVSYGEVKIILTRKLFDKTV